MRECHDCGHEHATMASASRPLPGFTDWEFRFFCHENDHSCYQARYGNYWTEDQPTAGEIISSFMENMDRLLAETKKKLAVTKSKLEEL